MEEPRRGVRDLGRTHATDQAAFVTDKDNIAWTTGKPAAKFLIGYGAVYDALVAKLNAVGSALVYSTFLGGSQPRSPSPVQHLLGFQRLFVGSHVNNTSRVISLLFVIRDERSLFRKAIALQPQMSAHVRYFVLLGWSKADAASYNPQLAVDADKIAWITGNQRPSS